MKQEVIIRMRLQTNKHLSHFRPLFCWFAYMSNAIQYINNQEKSASKHPRQKISQNFSLKFERKICCCLWQTCSHIILYVTVLNKVEIFGQVVTLLSRNGMRYVDCIKYKEHWIALSRIIAVACPDPKNGLLSSAEMNQS